MQNLQDIIVNYPQIQPALSFTAGMVAQTVIRAYSSYVKDVNSIRMDDMFSAAAPFAIVITVTPDYVSEPLPLLNFAAAVVGQFISSKILDKFSYLKKSNLNV